MDNKKIAERIVSALFLHGATRLQLMRGLKVGAEEILGGWCKEAIRDCVLEILQRAKKRKGKKR